VKDSTFIRHNLPKGNVTIEKDRDPETIRIILQHLDVKAENEQWVYHKSISFIDVFKVKHDRKRL